MPTMNTNLEKRVHPRFSLNVPVHYQLAKNPKAPRRKNGRKITKTLDLSLGGAYLLADQTLEEGTQLELEITLPEADHAISTTAEVVWANETGLGLRFLALKDNDFNALRAYLSQRHPRHN